MVIACWSAKGGAGTTVVAASLALVSARVRRGEVLLVDLAGDAPAALGLTAPVDAGLVDWLAADADVPADGLARLELPVVAGVSVLPQGRGQVDGPARFDLLARLLSGDRRTVVVDCGRVVGPAVRSSAPGLVDLGLELARCATHSLLVTRPCYLALRRSAEAPLRPSGVVLLAEPGRALDATDVESVIGAPVVAQVSVDPAVARAVDAGLLASRLPRGLERALRGAA
jgi:cellulose biosynthesis protein BcsQ